MSIEDKHLAAIDELSATFAASFAQVIHSYCQIHNLDIRTVGIVMMPAMIESRSGGSCHLLVQSIGLSRETVVQLLDGAKAKVSSIEANRSPWHNGRSNPDAN